MRLCDPTCFNRRLDPGGGQGPSTAEVMAQHGVFLTPGDPNRRNKLQRMRERLAVPTDDEGRVVGRPLLMVYPSCAEFLRTMPQLAYDESNPEDIDTDQEDHVYDEAGLIVLYRTGGLGLGRRAVVGGDLAPSSIMAGAGGGDAIERAARKKWGMG